MDMINLLIFLALVVVFAGGWWCGYTYGSASEAWVEVRKVLRRKLGD
jgi:hypothetical protein